MKAMVNVEDRNEGSKTQHKENKEERKEGKNKLKTKSNADSN